MTEQRYTLDEASILLARQECAGRGHSWDVVETYERPTEVLCRRCGVSYAVQANQPAASGG